MGTARVSSCLCFAHCVSPYNGVSVQNRTVYVEPATAQRFKPSALIVPQAKIERLKRDGLSLRAVAKQVGVSKTTILRASAL